MLDYSECIEEGWKWEIANRAIIPSVLKHLERPCNVVKQNSLRSVSIMKFNNEKYYVKYDVPIAQIAKISRIFKSKVQSEFVSYSLLEEHNIKVPKCIGYGSQGSKGVIITKEVLNTDNARDFWFAQVAGNKDKEKRFIKEFTKFLKSFFAAKFLHPDFHLGNLIIDKNSYELTMIDPYGISKQKKLSEKQILKMLQIISTFRGALYNKDIEQIIIDAKVTDKSGKAKLLWNTILKSTGLKVRKNWKKREEQILNKNSKYVEEVIGKNKNIFLFRKGQDRQCVISPNIIKNKKKLEKIFDKQEYPNDIIERVWLSSFCLQFHEIRHQRPLIYDVTNSILYFEKINKEQKIKNYDAEREFLAKLNLAGFSINNIESKIFESNNEIYLNL